MNNDTPKNELEEMPDALKYVGTIRDIAHMKNTDTGEELTVHIWRLKIDYMTQAGQRTLPCVIPCGIPISQVAVILQQYAAALLADVEKNTFIKTPPGMAKAQLVQKKGSGGNGDGKR